MLKGGKLPDKKQPSHPKHRHEGHPNSYIIFYSVSDGAE